jgi:hypothetical protein
MTFDAEVVPSKVEGSDGSREGQRHTTDTGHHDIRKGALPRIKDQM